MSARLNRFVPVTADAPCAVCGKPDWCRATADGAVVECKRVPEGAFKTKDTAAGTVHYHRIRAICPGRPANDAPPLPPPGAPRADADALHAVYSALLGKLTLSKAHREALGKRGLDDDAVERGQYRTLPVQGRAKAAGELRETFGDALRRVPGFVVKEGESGPYYTIAGAAGVVVPVRDPKGRIIALKVRADGRGKGPRYTYVTSTGQGGPGPGSPAHVPAGTPAESALVRLTEGELKADVAFALSKVPTVSFPGATVWRAALPVLQELGCKTARLAFDADAADNPNVARALAACTDALAGEGLAVEMERWDAADGKGIDDVLAAGKPLEVLEGEDAREAVRAVGAAAGVEEGEPDAGPTVAGRVREVLDGRGAAALFGDADLLRELAAQAEDDPAGFASVRAAVRERLSLRDLDKALKPLRSDLRRERRGEAGGAPAGPPYAEEGGRIVRVVETEDGPACVPLCNFTARIVEEVVRDDGSGEAARVLAVEGRLADGRLLGRAEVAAADFARMEWLVPVWGRRQR